MECHPNGMSLKIECNSKLNVTKNEMALKIDCQPKWNVIQNRMSLKMENWNVT